MNFPKLKTITYVDYLEMQNYIDEKYKIDQRDYAGKFGENPDMTRPYQDFWHFAIDALFADTMANGYMGDISFLQARDYAAEKEGFEWAVEILDMYIAEFSEFWKNDPDGFFTVKVEW